MPQYLSQNNSGRLVHLDLMRIISSLAVILIHVACQGWYSSSISINEWQVCNFYTSISHWCVPVFVMVSGALNLHGGRKTDIKRIYTHNIANILIMFILWSLIYALFDTDIVGNTINFLTTVYNGPVHLWFLKMLIGLFIMLPILKMIVLRKDIEEYFIIISITTCFIAPCIIILLEIYNIRLMFWFKEWYDKLYLEIALGYSGYFVLGHYLTTYSISRRLRIIVYILGIAALSSSICLTNMKSPFVMGHTGFFYNYLNVFTLLESCAMFLFILYNKEFIASKYNSLIFNMAKMSLGIYLIHMLILNELFKHFGLDYSFFNPAWFIPIYSLFVFAVSYLIVGLIYRIPYLKVLVVWPKSAFKQKAL